MLIGNIVAMLAASGALGLYFGIVRNGRVRWDKTAHVFPIADAMTARRVADAAPPYASCWRSSSPG